MVQPWLYSKTAVSKKWKSSINTLFKALHVLSIADQWQNLAKSTLVLAQGHSKTIHKSSPAKGVKTNFTHSVLVMEPLTGVHIKGFLHFSTLLPSLHLPPHSCLSVSRTEREDSVCHTRGGSASRASSERACTLATWTQKWAPASKSPWGHRTACAGRGCFPQEEPDQHQSGLLLCASMACLSWAGCHPSAAQSYWYF